MSGTIQAPSQRPRIVIVGAGISGLSAAFRLTRPLPEGQIQPEVLILESSYRAGGLISSGKLNDCLLEFGPDAFLTEKKEAINLCQELGLQDQLIETNKSFRRSFIAYGGQLYTLPDGFSLLAPTKFKPFFASPLLSLWGKLRMTMELLLPPGPAGVDESLAQFVQRRFGQEALERIAQPMFSGIYTGDPQQLSVRATMPRFIELEQKYGSVTRGLIEERKNNQLAESAGARYSMFASLNQGLEQLVHALIRELPGGTLHYQCPITAVKQGSQGKTYDVVVYDGRVVPADVVIICAPAFAAAQITNNLDPQLTAELSKIQHASSAVLNLIYNRADIPHPLNGFGFVVPSTEKRNIIACSFNSIKFADRCPENKVILRLFIGGALQKNIYDFTDEAIECLAWQDLNTYLGITALPIHSFITRHPRSMPQYNVGHVELVERIQTRLADNPGLLLAGNSYSGVGIPDCIRSGEQAAQAALATIKKQPSLSS